MDQNERDYLRRQVQELTRANRRWKTLTILVSTAFAIFLIVQAVAVLGHGMFSIPMWREAERARMEADLARMEAEQMYAQRIALEEARQAVLQTRQFSETGEEPAELLGYPRADKAELPESKARN